ncbi:SsrA-binding protein [Abditibacterium utsteinense]|uniref:SsrA-binding protein n=1 Tax=Abditibacterium utsteinense TaxID=1960156 RepID=A0A2S8SXD1_9BACT|nr:SsrA-binding protein SmpB [Abditibacterium utsteinense]PQV65462.1 SsrA-binding protein [Abditibacterium utsteinense]
MAEKKKKLLGDETIAQNRRARHDYEISDSMEAGLVLTGTEVKSLREGGAQIAESYASVESGTRKVPEVWVVGLYIPPYKAGTYNNVDSRRKRKLLLHRGQINKLIGQTAQKGYTLVPLKLYFTRGKAKLEIGVAKGRQKHDKRRAIADREVKRDIERETR